MLDLERFRAELSQADGHTWVKSVVELHDSYNELVVFIKIRGQYQLVESHLLLRRILGKYRDQINEYIPTVSYLEYKEGKKINHDFIEDWHNINDPARLRQIGNFPVENESRGETIFDAYDRK